MNSVYKKNANGKNRIRLALKAPSKGCSYELDPVSGKIKWPAPLLEPEYAQLRTDLDQLFALGATSGQTGTAAQIREDIRQLREALRSNIETMPANDYIAARKFLDSLDYSIVQPAR